MITTKKELKFYIAADRIMNGYTPKRTFKSFMKETFFWGGDVMIIKYLYHLRRYAYFRNTHKKLISYNSIMLLWEHYRLNKYAVKCGFSIGCNSLGYGVVIPHYGTIVINGDSSIGAFSVIHTCTCIAGGGKKIGESFYLSTGSQLVGEFDIGDNVCIAAHSLVNKSFGNNVLVAGAPGYVKKDFYPSWWEKSGDKYKQRVYDVRRLFVENNII